MRETIETGEPATARVEMVGRIPDGTEVSRVVFQWPFKKRDERLGPLSRTHHGSGLESLRMTV
ncbi:MAG: hypothetical protein GY719_34900 [bacterium]|nr:hypothetical protein [bacterium]